MAICIRCSKEWTGLGSYCTDCQQLEVLEKQRKDALEFEENRDRHNRRQIELQEEANIEATRLKEIELGIKAQELQIKEEKNQKLFEIEEEKNQILINEARKQTKILSEQRITEKAAYKRGFDLQVEENSDDEFITLKSDLNGNISIKAIACGFETDALVESWIKGVKDRIAKEKVKKSDLLLSVKEYFKANPLNSFIANFKSGQIEIKTKKINPNVYLYTNVGFFLSLSCSEKKQTAWIESIHFPFESMFDKDLQNFLLKLIQDKFKEFYPQIKDRMGKYENEVLLKHELQLTHQKLIIEENVKKIFGIFKKSKKAVPLVEEPISFNDFIFKDFNSNIAEIIIDPKRVSESVKDKSSEDPLYDQAVQLVIESKKPSISYVQRNLRIGYNRAARIIEDMEKAGLISPMQSNGNREVIEPNQEIRSPVEIDLDLASKDIYETYIDIVGIDEYSDAEKRAHDAYQELINPAQSKKFVEPKDTGKVKILFKD